MFPLLGISGYMMFKLMAGRAGQQSDIYAGAGAIAQQVLSVTYFSNNYFYAFPLLYFLKHFFKL